MVHVELPAAVKPRCLQLPRPYCVPRWLLSAKNHTINGPDDFTAAAGYAELVPALDSRDVCTMSDMLAGGPSTGFGEGALLETDDSRPLLPALLRGNPTRTFWILDELDNVDIKSAELRAPHTYMWPPQPAQMHRLQGYPSEQVAQQNRAPVRIRVQSTVDCACGIKSFAC